MVLSLLSANRSRDFVSGGNVTGPVVQAKRNSDEPGKEISSSASVALVPKAGAPGPGNPPSGNPPLPIEPQLASCR